MPDGVRAGGLLDEIARFDAFGTPTERASDGGIPYFINEFWTSGQRQANALHEISYRACFKPQLPRFFIERLTQPGELVHDPFMGRGTTPIEAALLGRAASGSDANPLSVLLTRPRLAPPSPPAVAAALARIDWEAGGAGPPGLLAFYHPCTLRRLEALRVWLARAAPLEDRAPDPVADWIRMVALNRLTGHSPGFFSTRTMPPNQAVSVEAQLRMNARAGVMPPERDVAALILKKTRSLVADGGVVPVSAALGTGAAEATRFLADGSVSLVVTSPPFLDVVHYAADNWLRCWFAGIAPESVALSMHRDEAGWERMVRAALRECARVVRPGGHVAFEVGEVRGGRVLLERAVWRAAEGLGFARLGVLVNRQRFTKTANCWGVANNRLGTNSNRVVLLRRERG